MITPALQWGLKWAPLHASRSPSSLTALALPSTVPNLLYLSPLVNSPRGSHGIFILSHGTAVPTRSQDCHGPMNSGSPFPWPTLLHLKNHPPQLPYLCPKGLVRTGATTPHHGLSSQCWSKPLGAYLLNYSLFIDKLSCAVKPLTCFSGPHIGPNSSGILLSCPVLFHYGLDISITNLLLYPPLSVRYPEVRES